MAVDGWIGPDGQLGRYISKEYGRSLDGYRVQPNWIDEHANEELDTALGGYQYRQLFELVQNSADALWVEAWARDGDDRQTPGRGRIEVRLTAGYLHCSDDGDPITEEGVKALMFSRLPPKRATTS